MAVLGLAELRFAETEDQSKVKPLVKMELKEEQHGFSCIEGEHAWQADEGRSRATALSVVVLRSTIPISSVISGSRPCLEGS